MKQDSDQETEVALGLKEGTCSSVNYSVFSKRIKDVILPKVNKTYIDYYKKEKITESFVNYDNDNDLLNDKNNSKDFARYDNYCDFLK